jgi:hypothetical protein
MDRRPLAPTSDCVAEYTGADLFCRQRGAFAEVVESAVDLELGQFFLDALPG